ncbi:ArsR family transcriptional regulator [Sinobacterium caligoides]|uniref:ArsR family transcriptional regulator n=1 Tax=Sinobacterium caligoides TaxID=933926 RepID=A0A3N2DNR9_9GAMM|nr:metalloregulator ArsR/SmtB family transcription factor [Sinobacterium caligoides]ROS01461.1 ArsR family transcriptional regulator [Sinobacterium caligoides]
MPAIETRKLNVGEAAALLKVLSNPHRLLAVYLLLFDELSVGELNRQLPLSQSALSQHLAILRAHDIVTTRREAQVVYYRLSRPEVREIIMLLQTI